MNTISTLRKYFFLRISEFINSAMKGNERKMTMNKKKKLEFIN